MAWVVCRRIAGPARSCAAMASCLGFPAFLPRDPPGGFASERVSAIIPTLVGCSRAGSPVHCLLFSPGSFSPALNMTTIAHVTIAVIGAGLFGRKHIETIRQEPACRLAAIADPTPEAEAYATGNLVFRISRITAKCSTGCDRKRRSWPRPMFCMSRSGWRVSSVAWHLLVEKADCRFGAIGLATGRSRRARAGVSLLVGASPAPQPDHREGARSRAGAGAIGRGNGDLRANGCC